MKKILILCFVLILVSTKSKAQSSFACRLHSAYDGLESLNQDDDLIHFSYKMYQTTVVLLAKQIDLVSKSKRPQSVKAKLDILIKNSSHLNPPEHFNIKIEQEFTLQLFEPKDGSPVYYAHKPNDIDIWGVKLPLLTEKYVAKDPNNFNIYGTILYFPDENDAGVRLSLFKNENSNTVIRYLWALTFDC